MALVTTQQTPAQRLDRAMRQAFHNLDMAEQHQQPPHVLDRFEAAYFAALARLDLFMRNQRATAQGA